MTKVLITGAGSYVGGSFAEYARKHYATGFEIDTIDMKQEAWKDYSFSGYDCIFHVAGIAHADVGKVSEDVKAQYYRVNTELAIETAAKAKAEGVGQFVFMSSAIVYGESAPIGHSKKITKDTPTSPANCYGDSKVQAENGLIPLNDESFKIVILRPPMIYGKGSKGNYPILAKIARKMPLFPYVVNERSMLYVENLCEFVRLVITDGESGTFWPQNREYSNTSELIKMIAETHGKKVRLIKGFTWALKIMSHMSGLVNKAFGSFSYDMNMSEYITDYRVTDLKGSIDLTEKD